MGIPKPWLCFGSPKDAKKRTRNIQAKPCQEDTEFVWEDIRKLTRGFKTSIGCGGFSIVYLGIMKNGNRCAVKAIDGRSQRARAEFERECKVLKELSHPNIVKMIGTASAVSSTTSLSGEEVEKKVLVLEYMPNGTLFDNLRSPKSLPWNQRLKIVLQVATGVEYLHRNFDAPIVHCDLKSSNIVLDENLDAKICDFGSARTEGESNHHKRERRRSGSGMGSVMMMMDSPGYMDPNFLKTGLPLQSKDIYCFGIMLAEILTGLEPFSEDRHPKLLSAYIAELFNGENKVLDAIDDRIRGSCTFEQAVKVARLSEHCMREDPLERPCITQVVQTLASM